MRINNLYFRNRFRVPSTRLHGFDYAGAGWYFITICTQGRTHWFGSIQNGIVGLSDIGCIVADELQRTVDIRTNVVLDTWIIMPDHVHAIIVINEMHDSCMVETHRRCVSTDVFALIPLPRRKPGSLGSIIAQFKPACTKRIRSMGYKHFAWQPRYYDRILWDGDAIFHVRSYIRNNPLKYNRNHSQ